MRSDDAMFPDTRIESYLSQTVSPFARGGAGGKIVVVTATVVLVVAGSCAAGVVSIGDARPGSSSTMRVTETATITRAAMAINHRVGFRMPRG
jgi:hypothetical protein